MYETTLRLIPFIVPSEKALRFDEHGIHRQAQTDNWHELTQRFVKSL